VGGKGRALVLHWKNKLAILLMEGLPCLQTNWRDSGYERYALVWKNNCIRQPKEAADNTMTTLRRSVRKSLACSKSMEVPYYDFEVHLYDPPT